MLTNTNNAMPTSPDEQLPAWLTAGGGVGPLESPVAKQPRGGGGRVSKRDVAELTAQLAIMTQSGVDIGSALGSLARQCQRPALADVLETVHNDVMGGAAFSEALRKHPKIFDGAYTATVASGEATGRMSEVLAQLAELQRSELRMRRTIRGVMIYPVVLSFVSVGVIIAMLLFVLPQFAGIFADYEIPLPMVTTILIAVSDELRGRWWFWAPVAIGAVVGLAWLRSTDAGREVSDPLLLKIGALKLVIQTVIVGRMCRLMGLMIDSGVPLLECLSLTRNAIRHTSFRRLLANLEESVTNGQGMTSTLEKSDVFPASATEMIGAAERSGKLGEVLQMVGAYFEEEGEAATKQAASLLEPLITVCMGAVVAVIVLAVMLPVFDLSSFARK